MEWIQAFLIAVILAAIVNNFLFEVVVVDKTSMIPTLQKNDRLIVNRLVYRVSEASRGEIIILRNPEDQQELYVKRLIGLPGDTIEIKDGALYINGSLVEEPYLTEPMVGEYETTVPEGTYFVMGDNRRYSKDSRDIGCIPVDNIIGRAEMRVWPFSAFKTLSNPLKNTVFAAPPAASAP